MAIPVLLELCVHQKIWKIQNIYLTRTNFLIQMSEFKDGFLKFNLKKDKQRLEKVMFLLKTDKQRLKKDMLRLKDEKLRMMLLLKEKLRMILLLKEQKLRMMLLLVEEEKLRLKTHKQRLEKETLRLKKDDKEMNDQILQGTGIDQEERMNYQILQGARIDLATEIASSPMEEDNLVLAHPNKFSILLIDTISSLDV
jgi:hypothetical protein